MRAHKLLPALATIAFLSVPGPGAPTGDLAADFAHPPLELRGRPLWFWNGPLTRDGIREAMERSRESGYCGFGILPSPGMTPAYLSDEYLALYEYAADTAERLGMKLTLYDEFWFPSGYAGGEIAARHPECLSKRLDMRAEDVEGPAEVRRPLPPGRLMAAVAMLEGTKERRDLEPSIAGGELRWEAPPGKWKVLLFTCVTDGARGLIDYLDPEAVRRFVSLTHERYYARMARHFGKTIDGAFYDEPTFHWIEGGRAWTGEFNAKFEAATGVRPQLLYPALWLDIGTETDAARNALFGFRADLYAQGFPKVLDDWCRERGIVSTGHVDQEEVVNPVGLCGDLMKAFRHQAVPGLDSIFQYGRGSPMYKIVSSAAHIYDRELVMTEVFGAMGEGIGVPTLYREAMDELTKGINWIVPHAIWYDAAHVGAPPELSWRSATYGPALPAFNEWVGRCSRLLRGGRHVADIAILYPIAGLQAAYRFGVGVPYEGGVIPPEADYMRVGEALSLDVRRDFTWVHPEILDARCDVAAPRDASAPETGARIVLDNERNFESWRAIVLPGSRAISLSNLHKVERFFEAGGAVIATTRLPTRSAEPGKDADVAAAIRRLFGIDAPGPAHGFRVAASSAWAAGGHGPELAFDGDADTRWNAADGTKGDQWIEVTFDEPQAIDGARILEPFDRVRAHRLQSWDGSRWVDMAEGAKIGRERSVAFPQRVATRVRLLIESISSDSASIAEMELLCGGRSVLEQPVVRRWGAAGGKAWFLPRPSAGALRAALAEAIPVPDVAIGLEGHLPGGNLSYVHRVLEGWDVWLFANSSDREVDVPVDLRGDGALEAWDPYRGTVDPLASETLPAPAGTGGGSVTRFRLRLPAVRSVFVVSRTSR